MSNTTTTRAEVEARVGQAYRCPDGVVRWITAISRRRRYALLWLDEKTGVWRDGGTIKPEAWPDLAEPVRAPQPGEVYKHAGVFTGWHEVRVPERKS